MKRDHLVHKSMLAVLLVLLCGAPMFLGGCGPKEEEPPAPETPGKTEAPAAPAQPAEPAQPKYTYGPDAPTTVPVLRMIPESAVMTLAFPSITSLYDTITTIASRYVPPEKVQAAVGGFTSGMASEFGVTDAKTPMDVALARGFDPDQPIGVYADFEEFSKALNEAMEEAAAEQASKPNPSGDADPPAESEAEEPAAPEAAAEPGEEPAAPEAPGEEGAAPPQPQPEELMQKAFAIAMEKAPPAVVVAWTATDVPTAENSLRELYAEYLEGSMGDAEEKTIEVEGATIHSFGEGRYAYAFVDQRVFAGTSVPMMRACMGRIDAQPPTPYGTAAMPALRRDEIAMLLDAERAIEEFKHLAPAISKMPGGQDVKTFDSFVDTWKGYYEGAGLVVYTLDGIPAEDTQPPEVVARGMMKRTPALDKLIGEIRPLRLAPIMPAKTQLLFGEQFSEEVKEMVREQWNLSIPPEARKEGAGAQAFEGLNKALDLIKDEVAFGIAPTEVGLPGVLLVLSLTDVEQAKSFIGGFVPTTVAEEYKGVQILNVAYPIPMMTVSMAYVGNDLVVGTDLPLIKGLIDRLKGEAPPELFATLVPPIKLDEPLQAIVIIQSQLLIDVVVPLSAFAGGLGEAQKPVDAITDVVREFRIISTVQDELYLSHMTLYLK